MTDATSPTAAQAAALRGEPKRVFVRDLFDRLAPRYDRLNLVISLGQTTLWRRAALSDLDLRSGQRVLDVGCGTGWTGRFLRDRCPGLEIEGLDLSPGMIAEAQRRDPQGRYFEGDAAAIARPEASYDLVTTIYTSRNFPDPDRALSELVRVLRPGGRLVLLDTFPPGGPAPWRAFHAFWLRHAVPALVRPFADPNAFAYLAESILAHLPAAEMARRLEGLGCETEVRAYSLGAAYRILATKSRIVSRADPRAGGPTSL